MAHFAGHDGPAPNQDFAREFQGGEFLQNVQAGIDPANRRRELDIGRLARTHQLSPAQESFIISQGQTAQAGSLVNARLRADFQRAEAERRERLIAEQREFQVAEEQRRFRREQSILGQQQRQGLLGSIFGNVARLGGRLLGSALGGPVGALAAGPPGAPQGQSFNPFQGLPPPPPLPPLDF